MMRIFTVLLFCLPFSILAQNKAFKIIEKINAKIKDTIPFKTTIKYTHHSWDVKEIKSNVSTHYYKLVDTSKDGYMQYDYFIENDIIFFYKNDKIKKLYSESKLSVIKPIRSFGVYELFPGFKTIENPLIVGIVGDESDEIFLDSNKKKYFLKIISSKKNLENALADTLLEGAYKIQYEYIISKKNYDIKKAVKIVQTDKGDLYSSLEFKTNYIKDKKFNKVLRKFFSKSLFMNLDELIEAREKISYPQDSSISFNIKTIDGKMIDTENDSIKIFVLDFWFAACGPCRMAMPYLDSLHQKYKGQNVVVLGLNWSDKDSAKINKVLRITKATYPTSMEALELVKELKIQTYPYLIILNQERKIIFAESGFSKERMKEIDELISKELKK